MRDQIVDFMRRWSEKTEIPAGRFIAWLGIAPSKFYSWRGRYGCVNEHNAWVPRDFWLQEWEKQAILDFYRQHPLQGYRRLIERYVVHYNTVRLHSAIGFVTPADMLAGRREQIHAARDRKLEQAREQRQLRRRQAV